MPSKLAALAALALVLGCAGVARAAADSQYGEAALYHACRYKPASWPPLAPLMSSPAPPAPASACPSTCDPKLGCNCASQTPPGGLSAADTPQFIVLVRLGVVGSGLWAAVCWQAQCTGLPRRCGPGGATGVQRWGCAHPLRGLAAPSSPHPPQHLSARPARLLTSLPCCAPRNHHPPCRPTTTPSPSSPSPSS